jgi:hypothetical protein
MKWLLMALFCAASTPAAAAAEDPDLSWAAGIEARDWVFVGLSAATMMFIKPAPSPAGSAYRRIYVRFEEAAPFNRTNFAAMASVEVDEIDCAKRSTRVLEITHYAERNMKGESRVDPVEAPMWNVETQGSFGAGILNKSCSTLL